MLSGLSKIAFIEMESQLVRKKQKLDLNIKLKIIFAQVAE